MFRRFLLIFVLLFSLFVLNAFLNPIPKKNSPLGFKVSYGVSYSFEQAQWYGLDGRDAFVELLDTTRFDWVRLPFFWDEMVDKKGRLKLEDLEFAILEAKKRNVKVVIALGAKVPYYPEYHLPQRIKNQLKFGETIGLDHPIAAEILEIDKKVVRELSKYDNISHWQVENEPFLANVNNWKIDESLLSAEIEVVRENDPKMRPVILNHVGPAVFDKRYKSLLSLLLPGDVFGVNAYFKTQGVYLMAFRIFGKEVKIDWPHFLVWPVQSWSGFSPNFSNLKKESEKRGVDFWILEVQSEPYIRALDDAKRNQSYFTAGDIEAASTFLNSFRINSMGLWGAHFWQYRARIGDKSWEDSVKKLIN